MHTLALIGPNNAKGSPSIQYLPLSQSALLLHEPIAHEQTCPHVDFLVPRSSFRVVDQLLSLHVVRSPSSEQRLASSSLQDPLLQINDGSGWQTPFTQTPLWQLPFDWQGTRCLSSMVSLPPAAAMTTVKKAKRTKIAFLSLISSHHRA